MLSEETKKKIEELRMEHERMKDPEYRRQKQIESLESMKPFDKNNSECVPDIPQMKPEDYQKYVIPNYIRCGAIPKSELIDGKRYYGACRNADAACWHADKNKFTYERFKWGFTYPEDINHFEDDNGFDLFVPLRLYYED